jgi:dTDP-4-amino-4,6-dideoxygalactose transaminase
MRNPIPHSRPDLGRAEERAVIRALRSGMIGGGPETASFERELAAFVGVRGAVAVHSGSAALHAALLALGVGKGDRVLLPTYACAAVLNAVRYTGAAEILADVDPATGNLDPADARRRLRARTKALIVPHLFGRPAPLAELRRLGVPVVEDCAMAVGGGTGAGGALSIFSFYATKMLAAGHGGGVATSDRRLLARVQDLAGYDEREDYAVRHNWRMSGLAAALARVQLARLPEFVQRRRRMAEYYFKATGRGSVEPGHVYYRFVVRARAVAPLVRFMASRGIEAKRPVFRPLHRYFPGAAGDYPGAEELHRSAVSVPFYPALRRGELERVARALREGAALLA